MQGTFIYIYSHVILGLYQIYFLVFVFFLLKCYLIQYYILDQHTMKNVVVLASHLVMIFILSS